MSNVVPIYPSAVFTWVDRVDQVNIDFANDVNSVASDLISTEITLGINPQIEKNPPNGKTSVSYSSVDARISDAMTNNQLPVVRLKGVEQNVPANLSGVLNKYVASFDPYGLYNGSDITININGWWYITNIQRWDWWGDGFVHQTLTLNGQGNVLTEDIIDWAFSGNVLETNIPDDVPRWQLFGLRPRVSTVAWQGILQKGDRISVYSENGTSHSSFGLDDFVLSASCLRILPAGAVSTPGIV